MDDPEARNERHDLHTRRPFCSSCALAGFGGTFHMIPSLINVYFLAQEFRTRYIQLVFGAARVLDLNIQVLKFFIINLSLMQDVQTKFM